MKLFVIIIFLVSYCLIIVKRKWQLAIVYVAAALLILGRAISLKEVIQAINLNVLGIFLGMMVLSALFVFSGAPAYLANKLILKCRNKVTIFLMLCVISGFISVFIENIATLLIIAPVAFEVSRRLKTTPIPLLIGIAVSSNLQGCATLIGDPPSMILATYNGMNFNDFFWMEGKPGIFFAVQLGALVSFGVLYKMFTKMNFFSNSNSSLPPSGKVETNVVRNCDIRESKKDISKEVKSWVPTVMMILVIASLAGYSFLPLKFPYAMALISIVYATLGIIWHIIFHKESISFFRDLDWQTLFFLIGIFIIIGSLTVSGIIGDIAQGLSSLVEGNKFLAYTSLVWLSVFISAFVDNIPYTMAMIPVAKITAQNLSISPHLFLFGLLIGTCLGGNITPIGAGTNIAAVGLLRKEGYKVSFKEFVRVGFPFTLAGVILSYLFLWIVWAR